MRALRPRADGSRERRLGPRWAQALSALAPVLPDAFASDALRAMTRFGRRAHAGAREG
jgi:hypothetical protein